MSGWPRPSSTRAAVGVRALARQLPVEAVARLEGERLAGRDARDRLEVRVPAIVRGGRRDPHRSSPTRSAARVAAATSSGRPPARRAELVQREDRLRAARRAAPASRSAPRGRRRRRASRWNAGSSYAAAQSSCTTCRPRCTSSTTGWVGRCTGARRGASRRRARAPPRRPGTACSPGTSRRSVTRLAPVASSSSASTSCSSDRSITRPGRDMLAPWRSTGSGRSSRSSRTSCARGVSRSSRRRGWSPPAPSSRTRSPDASSPTSSR